MKEIKTFLLLIVITLFMVGCGTSNNGDEDTGTVVNESENESGGEADGTGVPDRADFSDMELPLSNQLILGTFGLEDTEYAIDADQASELLPLWQVLSGLYDSDTAAEAEIDALVNQIAGVMTDEQMMAIENMEFGPDSMMTLMEDLGLNEGFQRPEGEWDVESADGGGFQPGEGMQVGGPGGGEMPEGVNPGGGQGMGGGMGIEGSNLTQEQIETLQAERGTNGGGGMGRLGNSTMLLEPLIELLQSKIS